MRFRFTLLFISILCTHFLQGQEAGIRGRLSDLNDKLPVAGATLVLASATDSLRKYTQTSTGSGAFRFTNLNAGSYNLIISSVGYEPLRLALEVETSLLRLDTIFLAKNASLLEEVVVNATPAPVRQKGDTLEYNASSYKVNPDANADDVIRKMPGITIEGGVVKAGGEDVRKVTVDGRDFFGDDATAALKNLPAEVVDKIQVFDRMSDQARFTGFDDGNTTKSINIVTKANMRNGQFGRVYGGYGTDNRYSAGGNVSIFSGNRRLSLVGISNNINQQNFATEDLLGVTSSGGGGGRGSRGRGGGGGGRGGGGYSGGGSFGGGGNFLVGQQSGISKTNAIGLNFSDQWGKKTEVAASYFYNNNQNNSNEDVNRAFFLAGDTSQLYDERQIESSKNNNHRINLRIEHKFDSANILLITPTLSFHRHSSLSELSGINSIKGKNISSQTASLNTSDMSGFNINNNILYRHAFAKRGRTISVSLNTGFNNNEGENYQDALNTYYEGGENIDTLRQLSDMMTNGVRVSSNLAYTEPVGSKGQLQVNYSPSWSKNKADQQTFRYDHGLDKYSNLDSSLSNVYDNIYTTQNAGVSYRIGDRNNMFSAGLAYQHANLSGHQFFPDQTAVNRTFSNLLPNLMWRVKLSEKSNLRVMYRSGTDAPSISQLQEVINYSNPLFLRTGNPGLSQEFSHRLMTRYTYTNSAKGQSFFANVFYSKTDDYIGNATYIASADSVLSNSITLYRGSQLIKPINMDGSWSVRSFFTFGMPLRFIKSNLNWNAGYGYSRTPGQINTQENLSNAHNYNLGAVVSSNVSEYVDFTLSYSANFNSVKNTIQPQQNNNYFTQVAGMQLNLLSKSGWFVLNELNNQSYRGLADGFNETYWLWNLSGGKKFLKDQKGELRLTVFDLLKQNNSIRRTATETYIEDRRVEVLQQYFMLTFSYRLRNFGPKR